MWRSFLKSQVILLRIRVPTNFAMVITGLQIVQMVIGCIVNVAVFGVKYQGMDCDVTLTNVAASILMYGSYFALFANFFLQKYISSLEPSVSAKLEAKKSK